MLMQHRNRLSGKRRGEKKKKKKKPTIQIMKEFIEDENDSCNITNMT
jgi:hypothetical protein